MADQSLTLWRRMVLKNTAIHRWPGVCKQYLKFYIINIDNLRNIYPFEIHPRTRRCWEETRGVGGVAEVWTIQDHHTTRFSIRKADLKLCKCSQVWRSLLTVDDLSNEDLLEDLYIYFDTANNFCIAKYTVRNYYPKPQWISELTESKKLAGEPQVSKKSYPSEHHYLETTTPTE